MENCPAINGNTGLSIVNDSSKMFLANVHGSYPVEEKIGSSGWDVFAFDGKELAVQSDPFRVRLIQPASTRGKPYLTPHIGQYCIEIGVDPEEDWMYVDHIDAIAVCILGYQFCMFPPYDGNMVNRPICHSWDGIAPASDVEEPQSTNCAKYYISQSGVPMPNAVCPMAMWGPNKERPKCRVTLNLLLLDFSKGLPLILPVRGMNLSAFNTYAKGYKKRLAKLKFLPDGKPSDYILRLTSKTEGLYSIMQFNMIKAPKEYSEFIEPYYAIALKYNEIIGKRYTSASRQVFDDIEAIDFQEKGVVDIPDAENILI